MIHIQQLVKRFGPHPVLRGIDLDVERGEFLTLVGPNGAGKTTLLRIIATLSRPTSGVVRLGGWRLPRMANRVRPHLGLLSHFPLLYNELTAEENLRFYAQMYNLEDAASRITQVIEAVGLSSRRSDQVGELSRGMQQRLAIARAILHRPEVLLMDEPYTGLDQNAATMLDNLLNEVAVAGRTVVLTTHNLTRGLANCDRVAILDKGRIVFSAKRVEFDLDNFGRLYGEMTGGRT